MHQICENRWKLLISLKFGEFWLAESGLEILTFEIEIKMKMSSIVQQPVYKLYVLAFKLSKKHDFFNLKSMQFYVLHSLSQTQFQIVYDFCKSFNIYKVSKLK